MTLALVTGGAGFIGSNLVDALLARGDRVRLLDDFSTGRRENVAHLTGEPRAEVLEGDVRDLALVRRAFAGVDVVFHQAALASVPRSVEDPIRSNEVNVGGTLNVLVAARDARVKRVVYASSSSVYGETEVLPKDEAMEPQPVSPYGLQKLCGEHYGRVFHRLFGLEAVGLRYFNVFGPRQDPRSDYAAVIPRFVTALLRGQPPTVFGDGEQSRDFTYVEDVVRANLCAAEAGGAAGEVFNVACGARYSLNAMLEILRDLTGARVAARHEDPRPGDIRHSQASIEKARRSLGFEPGVPFREGLARVVAWYRERT